MKKHFVTIVFAIAFLNNAIAQDGIGTKTPAPSSNLEITSTNKGVLFPRMSVGNVNDKNPITGTPSDGLLIFNTNTSTKYTLLNWNVDANAGLGAWNTQLLFKETPKTAVIALTGSDIPALNNADAGYTSNLIGTTNELAIISSGYLPNLAVSKTATNLVTTVGNGSYLLEVSFLIKAPLPDAGRGSPLQGSYYSMGYFIDFYLNTGGATQPGVRTERSSLSVLDEPHRVTFNISFNAVTNSTYPTSSFWLKIGRRSGSSHNDLVNIVPEGSYYKLTKLN